MGVLLAARAHLTSGTALWHMDATTEMAKQSTETGWQRSGP